MSRPQFKKKKKLSFWSADFSYSMQQQWTISLLDYDVWWKVAFMWQLVMTSSVVELRGSSKALLKGKLAPPKKRSWSLSGDLLPIWSTISFWILVKPLYLRSVLSKWMKWTQKCNTYWPHWSTGPNFLWQCPTMSHNQNFKSWTNWAIECCLICHIHLTSHQSTTMSSSILTTFCRENASLSRRPKMLFESSSNSKFHATENNKLNSH